MRRLPLLILALAIIPNSVFGAGAFRYGGAYPTGANEFFLRYSTLEERTEFDCTIAPLACKPTSPAPVIAGLPELPYEKNPAGDLALVSQAAEGRYIHTLYRIADGRATLQQILPFSEAISSPRWSANGKRLSFIAWASNSAVLADIPSNTLVQLVPLPGTGVSFSTLSSTGRYLALYAYGSTGSQVRRHHLIDFETGKTYATAQEKIAYWDLMTEENRLYSFSPDDRWLAYLDYRDGNQKPWLVDLTKLAGTSFRGEALTAKKYTVGDFLFADNDRLVFIANRTAPLQWDFWEYRFKQGTLTKIASDAAYYPPLKKAGDLVFFNVTTPQGSEVRMYDISARQTLSPPVSLPDTGYAIQKGELVRYGAVSGALLKPDGFSRNKTYPLVVWLHGGPHRQTSAGYHPYPSYGQHDWMLEEMRRNGALVLKVDYTGSYGYGRALAEALRANVGRKDVADVLAAVQGVKRAAKVSNVYLIGKSYGGYLALRTQVAYPATFAGAVSINGVTDWESLVRNDPNSIFRTHFNGSPTASNQKLYAWASISDRIDRLTGQKILIAHGTADLSVPNWQSDLMSEMLSTIGRNVEYVEYEGEDHNYAKRESVEDICRRAGTLVLGSAPQCRLIAD